MQVSPLQATGQSDDRTAGFVGIQGEVTAGAHGIGVNTPKAAAVAAATVGFDNAEHIPNVAILTTGIKSVIVATGNPPAKTRAFGTTTRGDGVVPNEH
jgi:hypothetical protein